MTIQLPADWNKTTVFDAARWFLHKKSLTHKQLQKLCYYAQAWHLALLDRPLFDEEFQAWIHGPVCPYLYADYADYGWKKIVKLTGEAPKFPDETLQVLKAVYRTYSKLSGAQLETLTHSEKPWQDARGNIPPYEPSTNVISNDVMKQFYAETYKQAQGD